jgi:hypothetical protein
MGILAPVHAAVSEMRMLVQVVPDAGHSANELGIGAELVAATERMKRLYAGGNPVESS